MLKISGDKLRIRGSIIQEFFAESIRGTLVEVGKLLQQRSAAGCSTIVMVAGFSESCIYMEAVKKRFSHLSVVVPQDAGLAVLKGAVIYGHVPSTVCERVVRFTYGIEASHPYKYTCFQPVGRKEEDDNGTMRCYDIFDLHVKMGTSVTVGKVHKENIYQPIHDFQEQLKLKVYASKKGNPQLVTEPGCMKIGTFTMHITNKGIGQMFGVSMMFGGTEIEVRCVEKSTGKVIKATMNFLG